MAGNSKGEKKKGGFNAQELNLQYYKQEKQTHF